MHSPLFADNITVTDNLSQTTTQPVTFLVPSNLRCALSQRIRKYGRLSTYLQILLQRYGTLAIEHRLHQPNHKVCIMYQPSEQDLQRVSCRLSEICLLEVAQISRYLSISRCYLFVLLLQRDISTCLRRRFKRSASTFVRRDERHFVIREIYERIVPDKSCRLRGLRIQLRKSGFLEFIRKRFGRKSKLAEPFQ